MPFRRRLKSVMQAKGFSQSRLAAESGVGQSTISQWVNGSSEPTWAAVCAIARAMDVSTEDFRPDGHNDKPIRDRLVVVTVEVGDDGGPLETVAEVPVRIRCSQPAPSKENGAVSL